jgi:hypothetical protein
MVPQLLLETQEISEYKPVMKNLRRIAHAKERMEISSLKSQLRYLTM